MFLELYKIEFKCSSDNIGAAIKQIDKKWNLSDKQVKIISPNMYFTDTHGFGNEFAPMGYISHDENDYYVAYCSVKHNRINELHKANINSLIRALAALFILNIYYSFEEIQIDKISDYNYTLNSNVFIVKFSINECSSNDILFVEEDADYLKKCRNFPKGFQILKVKNFLDIKMKPRT